MKKTIILGALAFLVLAIAVGAALLWYVMGKAMYQPGMVRSGASLVPPSPAGDAEFWNVESGIRLYHFSQGTGHNVLVIHGGPGFPIHQPLPGLEPLTARYRFHYYDQRGCGRSTRPIDRFSSPNYLENVKTLDQALGLGAQVADIERIRRILGDEQLILVGHSFGAFLASLYAAEFPERVKALILVGPADLLLMPSSSDFFQEIRNALPEAHRPDYDAFLKRYSDFGGIFGKSDADLKALNAEFGRYYEEASRARNTPLPPEAKSEDGGGWMVYGMYFSMGRRHDYRPAMRAVQAPVLVVHGDKDLQPEASSRSVASAFVHSRVAVIRKAGHFVFFDQPVEFAKVAGEFLDALPQ